MDIYYQVELIKSWEKQELEIKILLFGEKKENNSFEYSQTLKNHKANVTSLIQLRDGTFASSSADHTIIIWKEIKNENNNFIEYEMAYTVTDYPHGIYKLI